MELIPSNQTVLLKYLKDGAEISQIRAFVLKITPDAYNIKIAKDNMKTLEGFTSVAYINYSSQALAQASKIKLDAAIAAARSRSKRQDCLCDLSKCETFMKNEGHKPAPAARYPIWIGNLVDENVEDLTAIFSTFGMLSTFPTIRIYEGENRSAVINYTSFSSAMAAVDACNSNNVLFGNEKTGKICATAQVRDTTKFVENLCSILRKSSQGRIGHVEVEKLATENGVKPSLWWNTVLQNNDIFTVNGSRSWVSLKSAEPNIRPEPALARPPPSSAVVFPTAMVAQLPKTPENDPRQSLTTYATVPSPSVPNFWNNRNNISERQSGRGSSSPEPKSEGDTDKEEGGDVTRDPITMEVMRDPVLAADGYTYERAGIVSWLRGHGPVSMVTLAPLRHDFLTPNKAVRDLIMCRHPEVTLAPFNT